MRTLTDQEKLLYQRGRPLFHQRLLVWDGLAWQDMSSLAGSDWMMSASWTEQRDDPVVELEVVLRRERYFESLAPLQDSRLNRTTGSYSLLVDLGRPVRFEVALTPSQSLPETGDWRRVFEGMIASVDVGSPLVRIRAMDHLHALQRLFIDAERVYGSPSGVAVEDVVQAIIKDNHGQRWQAGLVLSATTGDRITPTVQNGFFYLCTVSGTTAGPEPIWPTTLGATVVSGTATLRCEGVCPTLWVPVPTSAVRTTFTQRQVPVLQACLDVIVFIGWDLRYRYRASSGNFELCLYEPDRGALPGDETWGWTGGGDSPPVIGQGYYVGVLESGGHLLDFRTDVVLDWPDSTDLNPDGTGKRKRLHLADVQARGDYNLGVPRTFFVVEGTATQIDTLAEATTFATALLSDVSLPPQVRRLAVPLWPFGEAQDFYKVVANGVDGDTDEYLAVMSLEHHIGGEGSSGGDPGTTTITFHGTRPARRGLGGGQGSWSQYMGYPLGNSGPPPTAGPGAPTNVQASKVQGGVAVTFDPDRTVAKVAEVHELHVSTIPGFIPDSTTFRAMARNTNRFELGDLTAGVTYYAKVVPQDTRSQRGTASSQVVIDAGYTTPAAMLPAITYAALPYNPDFEANSTPGSPPDTWSMQTGTWNTDVVLDNTTFYSGANALKWPAASGVLAGIRSQLFVVQAADAYGLTARYRTNGYSGVLTSGALIFDWYSDPLTFLSSTTPTNLALAGSNGVWTRVADTAIAPVGARYARIRLVKLNNVPHDLWIDSLSLHPASFVNEAWFVVPVFTNGWANLAGASATAAYFKDTNGVVHLRGTIVPGSRNTSAFLLGFGYRPLNTLEFPAAGGGGVYAQVNITAAGLVICDVNVTAATWVSLNGISYRGEQ